MVCTERDLIVATQIAYYHFHNESFHKKYKNLRQLLMHDQKERIILEKNLLKAEKSKDHLRSLRAQRAIALYDEICAEHSKYGEWKLTAVKDDNKDSGFYGCLIEMDEQHGIIAYRGSESYDKNQIEKDWIDADLGLLHSTLTEQQLVATEFMEEVYGRFTYENYWISGHSLGGNLSLHSAVTAPVEMKHKIVRAVSFDGPGFSKEYLEMHQDKIISIAPKLQHFQWSLVGSLLYPAGNINASVQTDKVVYNNYNVEALFQKHDTGFVCFSEDGAVVPGEMDVFAKQTGELSRAIDSCPGWMGNILVHKISHLMLMPEEERNAGCRSIMHGLLALALKYPAPAAIGAVFVTSFIVIGYLEPQFYGKILIPTLLKALTETIDTGDMILKGVRKVLYDIADDAVIDNKVVERTLEQIVFIVPSLYAGFENMV